MGEQGLSTTPKSADVAGFGEHLRREREMRGISLQEICQTTKVSVRFLEALEREEFSRLPGGIFIRSFIRSYAQYLGLDTERVIAEFQLVAPAKPEEDFTKLGTTGSSPKPKRRMPLLPWAVAVVLLGSGYAMFRHTHRSAEASFSFSNPAPASPGASADGPESQAPGPTTAPQVLQEAAPALDGTRPSSTPDPPKTQSPSASGLPEVVTPQNDAERGGSSATVIRPVAAMSGAEDDPLAADPEPRDNFQGPASASIAAAEASGDLVLRVAATQSSWVAVDADGKVVLESVLNRDQVRTLVAKNFFDVTTANARGTTLILNGVTLQPLGRQGELKKVHLTHANLKQITP